MVHNSPILLGVGMVPLRIGLQPAQGCRVCVYHTFIGGNVRKTGHPQHNCHVIRCEGRPFLVTVLKGGALGGQSVKGERAMGKALRIGIITAYPREDWHSEQFIEAVHRFGEAVVIRPENLGARLTQSGVTVFVGTSESPAVDGFVLARGFGEKGNSDFLVPVYQILQRSGYVLVNGIDALLTAIDKFETSCRLQQAGVPTPFVVVAQEVETAHAVLQELGRLVAKPLFGSLGVGVELIQDTPEGQALLAELLARFGAIYLQEYVPIPGRDIRAFVVGDRVAASIYRKAAPGAWKTNITHGGVPEPCRLDAKQEQMAVTASRTVGLDYSGVDILEGPAGPVVIEVNGNPLWRGLQQATGQNMAEEIIAWVVARIQHTAGKGGEGVA